MPYVVLRPRSPFEPLGHLRRLSAACILLLIQVPMVSAAAPSLCGNGVCEREESCDSCPADCFDDQLKGEPFESIPAVSADGRSVAFAAHDPALPTGGFIHQIYVRDNETGSVVRLTSGNGDSVDPSISADGRFISFSSYATDLVPGDVNGARDVFVYDRDTDEDGLLDEPGSSPIVLASKSTAGLQGLGESSASDISADGRYISFQSDAANLVPGDTNLRRDIFVHDRLESRTARVSVSSQGLEGNNFSRGAFLSPDGRFVVFSSRATNFVTGDSGFRQKVFAHDRDADGNGVFDELGGIGTVLVSVANDGSQANADAVASDISREGRFVVFHTFADNLAGGGPNRPTLLVHDRDVDGNGIYDEPGGISTEGVDVPLRESRHSGGASFESASITDDGRFIAFSSARSTLVKRDTNENVDVFVRDRALRTTELVSVNHRGQQGNAGSLPPHISADGTTVAFASHATNLVPGDVSPQPGEAVSIDFFLRRLDAQTTHLVTGICR